MVALLVVLTLISLVLADGVVQFVQARHREAEAAKPVFEPLSLSAVDVPGGLFLSPGHTWIALKEDGKIKIGIDSLITGMTGKLSGFQLPSAGASFKNGEDLFSAEFGDRRLSFVSPMAGTVTRVNSEAAEEPPIISSSPYRHWICEIEPSEWPECGTS
jgi:glycine cleavage system H lipoate-binding protein